MSPGSWGSPLSNEPIHGPVAPFITVKINKNRKIVRIVKMFLVVVTRSAAKKLFGKAGLEDRQIERQSKQANRKRIDNVRPLSFSNRTISECVSNNLYTHRNILNSSHLSKITQTYNYSVPPTLFP